MFYDLENPMEFVKEVSSILDEHGVWVFEQSYMPLMLEQNSYDTACHEHLEYYGLIQIEWMLKRAGLKIIDIEFNDINGGSFSVTAAKLESSYPESKEALCILANEFNDGMNELAPFFAFASRVELCKEELLNFLREQQKAEKRVAFLGASTKGNVLLQYCDISTKLAECVGEVNQEKFGSFTPGTLLPIIDESELLENEPDYLVVLPWHFRNFFLQKYKLSKAKLVFPLPRIEII